MATTRNQDVQASITQTKDSLQQVTFDIASANDCIEKLENQTYKWFDSMDAKFIEKLSTL